VLYLFFAVLAGSYCLWFVDYAANPLWTDELITIVLVKSTSLKHLFSAVLLGLDATPPLYTSYGYGWFMLHNVVPGASPEQLLRITNASSWLRMSPWMKPMPPARNLANANSLPRRCRLSNAVTGQPRAGQTSTQGSRQRSQRHR